jgi:rhomboid protease GluP
MLRRKTSGSVVCPSCGSLVGVNDDRCYNCGRAHPGMWGFAPLLRQFGNDLGFVPLVIGASVTMFVLSLLLTGTLQGGGGMNMLAPRSAVLEFLGASGARPVFDYGRWWTVLSATWLHAGLLHILFNMMSLRNIGSDTVNIIGPGRTIIIYVISGVCGFLLTSIMGAAIPYIVMLPLPVFVLRMLVGAQLTVGASASIFGLLGALVHYGRKSGSSFIHGQAKQWALIMFIYGLIMPGIDNWAHAGGFLGGYLTSSFLNPLTRERGDHLLAAGGLLLLTFAAIALSVFESWSLRMM